MEHPQLIKESFPRLYNQFLSLSEGLPPRLRAGIPCVVLPDYDTALDWVEIKHSTELDGVGFEKWDAMATARVSERRGRYRRWRIALFRLEAAELDTTAIRAGIQDKTTAVERVLNSRAIKDTLGLVFQNNQGSVAFENGDETSGVRLLHELLRAMAEPGFRTGTVHALADREVFVRNFEALAVKGTTQNAAAPRDRAAGSPLGASETSGDPLSGDTRKAPNEGKSRRLGNASGKHPLRSNLDRRYLAPRDRSQTFHVVEPALNSLYRELRNLKVKGSAKTAAVLTRVFLELSCDFYLEQFVPLPAHFSKRGIKRWADARLREKVDAVLKHLDPESKQPELSFVRKALGGDDWLHSIDTLHEFVHSRLASVTENEAKVIWDRYQPFLKVLHDRISGST